MSNGKALSEAELQELVSSADGGARYLSGKIGAFLITLAVVWAVFQIVLASPVVNEILPGSVINNARQIHLAFAIFLAFTFFPAVKSSPRNHVPVQDWIMAGSGVFLALYGYFFYQKIVNSGGVADETDKWFALLGLALTRKGLRDYPGQLMLAALKRWQSWRPLLAVNRDIFIRSLVLQSVFFLITVQGARLGDATVAANALLLNGLLLTANALDGLAHAVEALCGHAIGARDREALRRSLNVATGWSLICSVAFAVFFVLAGHLFIEMQTDITEVREIAFIYLPYLAVLPLVAVWSYLLDGLFIGATRAREMRNAMVITALICSPLAWLASTFGNHGLWVVFLLFMALRAMTLGYIARGLNRSGGWFNP